MCQEAFSLVQLERRKYRKGKGKKKKIVRSEVTGWSPYAGRPGVTEFVTLSTPLLLPDMFPPQTLCWYQLFPRVLFFPILIVSFDSFTGELRGLYDCYFTANGRLSLCPFDQDFWENEDRCCGKFPFDAFHIPAF